MLFPHLRNYLPDTFANLSLLRNLRQETWPLVYHPMDVVGSDPQSQQDVSRGGHYFHPSRPVWQMEPDQTHGWRPAPHLADRSSVCILCGRWGRRPGQRKLRGALHSAVGGADLRQGVLDLPARIPPLPYMASPFCPHSSLDFSFFWRRR